MFDCDISEVAIYGAGAAFRSRSLSGLKLMLAEGHVLGQVIVIIIIDNCNEAKL